jgi:hypothetical protein
LQDDGFYFLELSLRVVEVIRGLMVKDRQEVRRLLGDMLDEMVKFMSLVVGGSPIMATTDPKQITNIIDLLFVLYPLSQQWILPLIYYLSPADPQSIVNRLSQQLPHEAHFRERAAILHTILDIIDQHRRINFDEETFEKSIAQEHELQLEAKTLVIIYRDRCYSMFELLDALEPLEKENLSEEREEDYYEIIYLL